MFRKFEPGQVLKFTYLHPQEDTGGQGLHDRFKEVMVLHPNWGGKLHAIDLKRLTPAERQVLTEVMDPKTYEPGYRSKHSLVEDIKRRMNVINEIKNPLTFYHNFVRPFIRGKDVYRQYETARILNPVVSKNPGTGGPGTPQQSTPMGNSGGLFKKPSQAQPLFKKP